LSRVSSADGDKIVKQRPKYLLELAREKAGEAITLSVDSQDTTLNQWLEAAGAADLVPLLKGPTAIATGPAEVPLAKELLTLSTLFPDFFVIGALLNKRRVLEFMEVERLSKLPASDVIHSQLVAQMLPGSSLQVPNVAAYLIGVLHMHVEAQQAASGGGAEAVSK
jgi:ribosomal protein L10